MQIYCRITLQLEYIFVVANFTAMSVERSALAVTVHNKALIKKTKSILERNYAYDKQHKIENGLIYTTLDPDALGDLQSMLKEGLDGKDEEVEILEIEKLEVEKRPEILQNVTVPNFIASWADSSEIADQLSMIFSNKWSIYKPMLLLNTSEEKINTLYSLLPSWDSTPDKFFHKMADYFKVSHIALNKPIPKSDPTDSNIKRIPYNIKPLYGDFGPDPTVSSLESPTTADFDAAFWCSANQNNVKQYWAPRYTMFSRGNVKEKLRILNMFENIENHDVVDLYAGIGYFSLCYLQRKCRRIFCWELNPWSIEGLIRGCVANNYKYQLTRASEPWECDFDAKVYIFSESNECALNRFSALKTQIKASKVAIAPLDISHINLGLLPSSRNSWSNASEIAISHSSGTSTVLHVHENVHINDLETFSNITRDELASLASEKYHVSLENVEKIKTYAPDVWHVCLDYEIEPEEVK